MTKIDVNEALNLVLQDPQIDFELTPELLEFSKVLSTNYSMLTGVYDALWHKKSEYTAKPLFSEGYVFNFNFDSQVVNVNHGQAVSELSVTQLRTLLGKIDAASSPIYPLGTVVKLNEDLLPEGLIERMQLSEQSSGFVILTGRKLNLVEDFNKYVVDYIGNFWPMGAFPNEQPMMISNMMIQKVEAKGYSNSDEEDYEDVLRTQQISNQQVSTAFMSEEDQESFLQTAVENGKEGVTRE